MRSVIILPVLASLCVISACSVQQENGQDLRVAPPPLLSEQQWGVKQQYVSAGGLHTCTVSAGGMDVTQQERHQHNTSSQVALAYPLNPGEMYTVLVNGHHYETRDSWFTPSTSEAIIRDLKMGKVAYTEIQNQFIDANERRQFNTIPLADFTKQYQLCTKFVRG